MRGRFKDSRALAGVLFLIVACKSPHLYLLSPYSVLPSPLQPVLVARVCQEGRAAVSILLSWVVDRVKAKIENVNLVPYQLSGGLM